jgi:hypothetical protein
MSESAGILNLNRVISFDFCVLSLKINFHKIYNTCIIQQKIFYSYTNKIITMF